MKIINYLNGVVREFKNVEWPTRKTTIMYTFGVIGISLLVIVYLGLLDFSFIELVNKYLI